MEGLELMFGVHVPTMNNIAIQKPVILVILP